MDLDEVFEELYTTDPGGFTAARDAYVQRARRSGEGELAKRIAGLRRPTIAAYACNLLVRRRPEQADRFAELGAELRRAQRELDPEQLPGLMAQQRQLVGALSAAARRLAAEAGHRVDEAGQRQVEQTLMAALADPDAAEQWRAGRLTRPLEPTAGLPEAESAKAAKAERKRGAEARRRQEQETKRARKEAENAQRELRARRSAREEAEELLAQAGRERDETRQRAEELAAALRRAEDAVARGEEAVREAADAEETARRAADEAQRRT